MTVGRTNEITLDEARRKAGRLLVEMRDGLDPKAEKQRAAEERRKEAELSVTLRAALDSYLSTRKDLKPKTAADYRWNLNRYLSDWLDLPLRSITREMVDFAIE